MKIIESKGNATLLGITKKSNKKLWNKLTKNGEIWEHYKDTIANNKPEVIAVKYGKKVIPLIGGRPSTSEKRIPQFRIQSAWANKAMEVEVKKNKLYLLQEAIVPHNEYGTVKWYTVRTFSLQRRNFEYKDGYMLNGLAEVGEYQGAWKAPQKTEYDYLLDRFSNKFDFFEEFGGNSYKKKRKGKKYTITAPRKYNKKFADKITGFKTSRDKLRIDTDSFEINKSSSLKTSKNRKAVKKLAKKDIDFLYDQKKGGLFFNENGSKKGFGDGGLIAILKGGPDLTSKNVNFI